VACLRVHWQCVFCIVLCLCMQCNVGKLCYLGLSVWNNVIQVYQWSNKHAQEWCDKCEGCIPPDSKRKKLYFCECVLYVVWLRTCVSWDTSLAKNGTWQRSLVLFDFESYPIAGWYWILLSGLHVLPFTTHWVIWYAACRGMQRRIEWTYLHTGI